MHLAVLKKNKVLVKILADKDVDSNIKNKDGKTALDLIENDKEFY